MLTIDKLRQYGAKVDVGLARCMDSEAMYDRLIGMALEPIYAPVSELTELLRNKTPGDYAGLLERIKTQRAALLALMEE